jgi:peptidoglycan hydrolase-like protein with peptidoglycan-binding domain
LRRQRLRVRGGSASLVVVALLVAVTGAGVAVGHSTGAIGGGGQALLSEAVHSSGPDVATVQQALGIPADGVFGHGTTVAVRSFQAQHGLLVDGIVGPQTRGALGLGAPAQHSTSPGTGATDASGAAPNLVAPSELQRIAQCESGGNPSAVGGGGRYRGKYQFDTGTWRSLGGQGDPAAAPEAEQDRLAARLYAQSGSAPWGACA